jgi:lysophospholipase L1-like esterase
MRSHPTPRAVAALALALALVSCSHSSGRAGAPASGSELPRRDVLVTIGADATFGVGLPSPLVDSWPQKLYHDAFAQSTVLVNAAYRSVTVARALAQQLPLALEVHATVVAVWLGDADLASHVSVESFEANLGVLVARLRGSGARVLLGNMSRTGAGAAAYDDAIERVARSRGATLVNLAAALSAFPKVTSNSQVGPAASTKIAKAFAAALARS